MSISTLYTCDCCAITTTDSAAFSPYPTVIAPPSSVQGTALLCPYCLLAISQSIQSAVTARLGSNQGKAYDTK